MAEFSEISHAMDTGLSLPASLQLPEVRIGDESLDGPSATDTAGMDTTCEVETGVLGVEEGLVVEVTVTAQPDRPPKYPTHVFLSPVPNEFKAREVFLTNSRRQPIPREAEHTGPEDRFIDKTNDTIVAIGDRIGVDMRDRIQPPEEHHIFKNRQDRDQGIRERWGDRMRHTASTNAFSSPHTGIVVVRNADGTLHGRTLAHEKAHGIEVQHTEVSRREAPSDATKHNVFTYSGYTDLCSDRFHNLKPAQFLTETTADIGGREMLLANGMTAPPVYRHAAILIGGVVHKIAEEFQAPPLEVADKLVLGSWTSDRTIIGLARTALGNEATDELVGITLYQTGRADVEAVAARWGLPGVHDNLQRLHAGQPVEYFDWLSDLYAKNT